MYKASVIELVKLAITLELRIRSLQSQSMKLQPGNPYYALREPKLEVFTEHILCGLQDDSELIAGIFRCIQQCVSKLPSDKNC